LTLKSQSVETRVVALLTRREHKWAGFTETVGRYVPIRMTDGAGHTVGAPHPSLKDWGGQYEPLFRRKRSDSAARSAAIGVPLGNIGLLHWRMGKRRCGPPSVGRTKWMTATTLNPPMS
jgi:muconate cycloisomerase